MAKMPIRMVINLHYSYPQDQLAAEQALRNNVIDYDMHG